MKNLITLFVITLTGISVFGQQAPNDTLIFKSIFHEALSNGKCYRVLDTLSNDIGGRLSGSPEAAKAVAYMEGVMKNYGFDTVYLQPVMVPHWVRGAKETAHFTVNKKKMEVNICALGGSEPTKGQISAPVLEVFSVKELEGLSADEVKGKIVFFNGPMNPAHVRTFKAYGHCGKQRWEGPWVATKMGAVGVVVRSLTHIEDEFPHTGSMGHNDSITAVPSAAISTLHANQLHEAMAQQKEVTFTMKMNCQTLPDVLSYNVIGEMWGTTKKDEIIVIGGHLDAWDNGDGAHDDGAGVVQSVEVLRIFKTLNLQPERTIRAVLFMNEENGLRGGHAVADSVSAKGEKLIAAIESDAGGFTPRYFVAQDRGERLAHVQAWTPLFEPYNGYAVEYGHGGADISPLNPEETLLMGYRPDSQRYFDYHHAATDVFSAVNQRELELGAANMTALVWMLSRYGVR
jgi:hypothetical protein